MLFYSTTVQLGMWTYKEEPLYMMLVRFDSTTDSTAVLMETTDCAPALTVVLLLLCYCTDSTVV